MGSVGSWPLAKLTEKTLGGKPKQVSASGVTCGRYPPPVGCMLHCAIVPGT